MLAATFLTLDDLAPDRSICGIGAWWDPLAANVGITRRKPLLAMRETVEVLRRLLAMENVTFHGEFHHVDGTSWLPVLDNPVPDETGRHWNLFTLMAGYRF